MNVFLSQMFFLCICTDYLLKDILIIYIIKITYSIEFNYVCPNSQTLSLWTVATLHMVLYLTYLILCVFYINSFLNHLSTNCSQYLKVTYTLIGTQIPKKMVLLFFIWHLYTAVVMNFVPCLCSWQNP